MVTALIIISILLVLMMTGMPISISLGLTVLVFSVLTSVPVESVALKLFTSIEKFEIMAIPFFILAGNFLTHGGVAKRMIALATALVGHWYGGLGLAGALACALFAAISGSSPATVVAIGSVLLPAMVRAGYPKSFGAGVITTSGALGILIPPSIVMVMYSVATETSVGDLFIAGIIPGIMLATFLGITTFIIAYIKKYPRVQLFEGRTGWQSSWSAFGGMWYALFWTVVPPIIIAQIVYQLLLLTNAVDARELSGIGALIGESFRVLGVINVFVFIGWLLFMQKARRFPIILKAIALEGRVVWEAYWDSIWGLLLIVVVMGGIYLGFFTPTEAAAMSAMYAFFVAVFVYGDIQFKDIAKKVLLPSANLSAMLLYIITNAALFAYLLSAEQIPQGMAQWMVDQNMSPVLFLLACNIVLLIAGNFMEPSSIVLILAPILFPVATKLGIDPIAFGIMMVVNMEIGMCHPPVGLNLYVASGITKMGITELTKAVMPWLLTMIVFLFIVTYIPIISTWLPNIMKSM